MLFYTHNAQAEGKLTVYCSVQNVTCEKVTKRFAKKWQCELIGIPHTSQGKYRLSARSKILFNYDEFWQENQGQLNGQYWQLPLESARKPLEEIASKKRSMYRKRYEMLDEMSKNISNFEPKHS